MNISPGKRKLRKKDGSADQGRPKGKNKKNRSMHCLYAFMPTGKAKGDQSQDGHLSETDRMSDEPMTTPAAGHAEMLCRLLRPSVGCE
jgi:hypothetical protein